MPVLPKVRADAVARPPNIGWTQDSTLAGGAHMLVPWECTLLGNASDAAGNTSRTR